MEGLFVVGLLVLVAAGAYWRWYQKKKRREALVFAARQLRLEYSQIDTSGCLDLPFTLLQKGDGRGTENAVWGSWQDMPVREFDYWYYTESTDSDRHRSKSYRYFSCAVTEIEAACSPVTIVRENLLTRLADAVGMDDIAFESQEVNDAMKAKDRRFANDLIDQRMMGWFLSSAPGFRFETCGRWLLCFGDRRKPLELIPLLGTLRRFRDQVPRVVFGLYPLATAAPPGSLA